MKEMTTKQALSRSEALCARSEQSRADIIDKLYRWGIAPSEHGAIVETLVNDGFVDEQRYARAYVRDRFNFAHWGRIKIAYNLRQKRIDGTIIDQALEEIDDGEYRKLAEELARAKWRDVRGREPLQARVALLRFLAQRGFEHDVSVQAVNRLLRGDSDDE